MLDRLFLSLFSLFSLGLFSLDLFSLDITPRLLLQLTPTAPLQQALSARQGMPLDESFTAAVAHLPTAAVPFIHAEKKKSNRIAERRGAPPRRERADDEYQHRGDQISR